MARWIAWFGLGCALVVMLVVLSQTGLAELDFVGGLVLIAMWAWAIITMYAVPIGVIRWLLRGRSRAS